jgi:hypothetical protein
MSARKSNRVASQNRAVFELLEGRRLLAVVYNPANGHYYELLPAAQTWTAAKSAAESLSYQGVSGHLATVGSAAENAFIQTNFAGSAGLWLGGFQSPATNVRSANWQWVTGESWSYTNWAPGEPNDHQGSPENVAEMYGTAGASPGRWNDDQATALVRGLVEYGVDARRSGVTVLVHGFDPWGGSDNPVAYWTEGHILSLLSRFGGGRVFVYDPGDGEFKQDTRASFMAYDDEDGEKILLHNWLSASNDQESGQAEAAAEALFAALVQSEYAKPSDPTASSKFHFIGHSRGASVVSEVVQRLGVYEIKVDYVTLLDSHDFDEPGVGLDTLDLDDNEFHDPATQIWSNVLYADNYWQEATPPFIPSGRGSPQLTNGYLYDYQLTNLPGFWDNKARAGQHHAHRNVIHWYFGTVSPGTAERRADWYTDDEGANTGFNRWFQTVGYGVEDPVDGIVNAVNPVTHDKLVHFFGEQEKSQDDDDASPLFFNGDFELADLGTSIAGWSYHGGGGTGRVHSHNGNHFLRLTWNSDALPTNFDSSTHNRFYVPGDATALQFKMLAKKSSVLKVYLDGVLATQWSISVKGSPTEFLPPLSIDLTGYADGVHTLKFAVSSKDSLSPAEVWIDDLEIITPSSATLAKAAAPAELLGLAALTPSLFSDLPVTRTGEGVWAAVASLVDRSSADAESVT